MIPWLGKMHQLGPKEEFLSYVLPGTALPNGLPNFPVKPNERRSYVANPTVWLTAEEGLYSDIQKLLRHAKKMPDKTSHFYKVRNPLCKNGSICLVTVIYSRIRLCISIVGIESNETMGADLGIWRSSGIPGLGKNHLI